MNKGFTKFVGQSARVCVHVLHWFLNPFTSRKQKGLDSRETRKTSSKKVTLTNNWKRANACAGRTTGTWGTRVVKDLCNVSWTVLGRGECYAFVSYPALIFVLPTHKKMERGELDEC